MATATQYHFLVFIINKTVRWINWF